MADVSGILAAGNPPGGTQNNPLAVIGQMATISNAMQQNKLMQQQLLNEQLTNRVGTQGLANKTQNDLAQKLFAINSLEDKDVPAAAAKILQDGLTTGLIDQSHYATFAPVVQSGNVGQIRQLANLGVIGELSGPEAIKAVMPSFTQVNQGNQMVPAQVGGPMGRGANQLTATGGPIPLNPGPDTMVQRTAGPPDTSGAPTTVPLSSVTPGNPAGAGSPTGIPMAPGIGGAPSIGGGAIPGNGNGGVRQPSGGGPAVQPAAPPRLQPAQTNAPNGAPPALPGQITTGLPPGQTIPMETSSKQFAEDQLNAGNYAGRVYPLQQAIRLLPSTGTGPGSEAINHIKSFLLTRASNMGWEPNKISVANFDELNKYLTQYINQQPFAAGSDAKLASALTGNPSVHISNLAATDTVKSLYALERMKQAAISTYHGTPQGYADYLKNYSSTVDPRAFMVDMMSKAKRDAMFSKMGNVERQKFNTSLDIAQHANLLDQTPPTE